ncbi:RNA-binding domain-containing protein [Defluviitalea phaphyphila]|uniref:RNA-binding domain-containing protein n=1 Tax=Defluviitalea phaphyphila TaxID=1473580 RepID=UPI0007303F9A|nr:RNA-binding domain-containing protein [Defluviitalea phaphyphila]
MDIHKLESLLRKPEGFKLDFKEKLKLNTETDKKEFVKDVCAIANTNGGRGYIIFGVKDKTKEIIGVELKPFNEEKIQQIICNRCDPPVPIRVDIINYKQKNIAVVTIFKSEQRPHQIRQTGTFYIRRGSTTDVARRHEIANMLQENGLISYEQVICRKVQITELDENLLKEHILGTGIILKEKKEILLEGLGIIGKETEKSIYHPTMGGLLLFGKCPQNYLPHIGIKIDYKNKIYNIKGNILEMLDKCENLISDFFKNTSYPVVSIYDAIANAVVHRDYWDMSREIVISIKDEKVEISNPGSISVGGSFKKITKRQELHRRNPWLYQRLLLMDKKGRFLKYGLGMQRIKKPFKNIGKVKVINLPNKNLFKIILPGEIYFSNKKN